MRPLTQHQRNVLGLLDGGPKTSSQIVEASWQRTGTGQLSYDEVHGVLRRLEDRELVRRLGYPSKWELTSAGRKALAA